MRQQLSTHELECRITELMLDLGIPAHLKGYRYLREAVLITQQDMEAVTGVTKLLYPSVARRYHTTESKVERAIRNAIEISWKRGRIQVWEDIFGYSSLTGKQRPTNSEYIFRLADKIRMDKNIEP